LPTAHGFDEFYRIPPDISWDSALYVDTIELAFAVREGIEGASRTKSAGCKYQCSGPPASRCRAFVDVLG
jgi:arylsulfatase